MGFLFCFKKKDDIILLILILENEYMKVAISGYAGVGKSSIVENVSLHNKEVIVFPESAREVNYTMNFYEIADIEGNFFQKSVMDNEIMKISIAYANSFKYALFDRCIIDNFSFAELYYGNNKVNYNKFQNFVDEFRFRYNIDFIYDSLIFIKSSRNKQFIEEVLLIDDFRKSTSSAKADSFIEMSKIWEEKYFGILEKVVGIIKDVTIVEHFTHNENFQKEIDTLLNNKFNKI